MAGRRVIRSEQLSRQVPRVSVVIPSYNYARYLPDAVGPVLSQVGVDVDVTIVDDASTDGSQSVATGLAEQDERVRLVVHGENRGHVETYNEALGYATGEYVVKLDADDLLTSGSLARSAALMDAVPDVVFCYGHPIAFRGEPPVNVSGAARNWTIWEGAAWRRTVLRRGHNVIMQPEVMLRRSAVEATGGYRPELRWAEDYNWWLRLSTVGGVGRVNGVAQGLYRIHDASLQRSADDLEFSDLQARVAAVDLYFQEHPPRDAAEAVLRREAFVSLLRDARSLAAQRQTETLATLRSEQFATLISELEMRVGTRVLRGPSASTSVVGRVYRDVQWRIRSRRWERWGI